jgi:two-component system, cell cycle sensor histidine kinase and response regulator CckA
LLLDMIMDPGMNGRETYEKVKKIHPEQKAIIVSGFAETEQVQETLRMGAGGFLKKPLILEDLGVAVKKELGKWIPSFPHKQAK